MAAGKRQGGVYRGDESVTVLIPGVLLWNVARLFKRTLVFRSKQMIPIGQV